MPQKSDRSSRTGGGHIPNAEAKRLREVGLMFDKGTHVVFRKEKTRIGQPYEGEGTYLYLFYAEDDSELCAKVSTDMGFDYELRPSEGDWWQLA